MIKKLFYSLFHYGPWQTFKSVYSALWKNNSFLNRFKLRFYIYLHNKSYSKITSLARRLNNNSHPKHKIIDYFSFFLSCVEKNDVILDVGCHEGYLSKIIAARAREVVGIDLNKKSLAIAKKENNLPNLSFVFGDAVSFEFNRQFNKIVLSNVLEHLENRVDFLKKLGRLSDTIILRVPLLTRDWLAVYKKENGFEYRLDPTHRIEYTLEGLKKELDESGWKIENFIVNFGEFLGVLSKK
ncbi:MAG: class I SAM-dependent methyltransferase [Candidatus Paceibacterota bacterium]